MACQRTRSAAGDHPPRSSVIAAFLRICPERLDLLHPHFRRLCLTLIDVDEWGQVYIIDLLMRYSRVYFPKPHMPEMAKTPLAKPKRAATANDSDDSQDDDASSSDDDAFAMPAGAAGTVAAIVDPDLRLLLDSLTPLLNSRNAAVIQSVASLYHHVAPENEVGRAARALTRLLSGPRETLFSILQTIKSLAAIRPEPFEPHIRRFFVRHDEPLFIRRLRLEVLASVTSSRTINIVLHELQLMARGRDAAVFFPDVVKNVISQNFQVRKLVYIYLLRYAEQEPDLALLSVNSFQKDLDDSNHVIRALALRVLSSIRVEVIVPIVLLAVKKRITDMSPHVRKAAAHALPKLYSLDPGQKDELIDVLTRMLSDRSTQVIAQPEGRARSLRQLAKLLYRPAPEDQAPAAPPQLSPVSRAALYWLIGTFAEDVPRVAPDVFRCAVIAFPAEDTDAHVRLLTLVLGAKLLARCHGDATATTAPLFTPKVSSRIRGLFAHLLTLARYDVSYDVRDRARFLQALLNACPVDAPMANGDNGEHPLHLKVDPTALQPAAVLARIMLAAPGATRAGSGASPLPGESPDVAALARALQDVSLNDDGSLSAEVAAAGLVLGSLSRLVGHRVTGYLPLPNWPTSPPPPSSVRDVLVPTGPAMGGEVVNNLTGMGSGPVGARGGSGLRAGATAPAGLHPAVKAAARKAPIRHDQSALDAFLASSSDEYDTEEDDEEESDGYDSEESDGYDSEESDGYDSEESDGYDSEESDGYDSDDEEDESDDEEGDNLLDLSAPAAGANHRDYFAMSSEGESGSEYDDESDGQGHAQASHWGNGSDEGSYDEEESDEGSYDEEESDEESEEESDEEEE
ncbi:hypothetical protein H696_03607 [Fonticula alba]|uniref:Clathrin/coatomer adaptor adaptin-like N-terminal domain-containing protein n=1 Tax=Fonticula alba TaxID=691883 RepID=A0A058Z898_FONAL|nr:hypothetical protein H696_03607 [Fonticula alba]KCV70148.1 hypothetical protein H696_03607 [Fonticula alba]|eukprot:XP_009495754.1 hypothetical protein H696_03607 [Fonticula alba]